MLLGSVIFGLIWCFKPIDRLEETARVEYPFEEKYLINERETVL